MLHAPLTHQPSGYDRITRWNWRYISCHLLETRARALYGTAACQAAHRAHNWQLVALSLEIPRKHTHSPTGPLAAV